MSDLPARFNGRGGVRGSRSLGVAVAVVAAACGLSHSVGGAVRAAPDATYSCALRVAGQLGFTVTRSQQESGYFLAERRATVSGATASADVFFTDLSVSVFTKEGQTQLVVTASRSKQEGTGPRSTSGLFLQDSDKLAADSVVNACSN